ILVPNGQRESIGTRPGVDVGGRQRLGVRVGVERDDRAVAKVPGDLVGVEGPRVAETAAERQRLPAHAAEGSRRSLDPGAGTDKGGDGRCHVVDGNTGTRNGRAAVLVGDGYADGVTTVRVAGWVIEVLVRGAEGQHAGAQ